MRNSFRITGLSDLAGTHTPPLLDLQTHILSDLVEPPDQSYASCMSRAMEHLLLSL